MTGTIQDKAQEASQWFERARRVEDDPESSFVRVKDEAPEWVTDLVYKAHGDFLPDDFRYAAIWKALDWIAEESGEDGDAYEFAYSSVDVYTSNLIAWLGSNLNRVSYCDEAQEELGEAQGIIEAMTRGQAVEYAEVYDAVRSSLESE